CNWCLGQKRTLSSVATMSALPPKADIGTQSRNVRFVPCVDGSELARGIFTLQPWSVQPCVRPVCAVHMTAGHNALRGSGPGPQGSRTSKIGITINANGLALFRRYLEAMLCIAAVRFVPKADIAQRARRETSKKKEAAGATPLSGSSSSQ